jgi:hypothetical protein
VLRSRSADPRCGAAAGRGGRGISNRGSRPFGAKASAASACFLPLGTDVFRNDEGRLVPAETIPGAGNFGRA